MSDFRMEEIRSLVPTSKGAAQFVNLSDGSGARRPIEMAYAFRLLKREHQLADAQESLQASGVYEGADGRILYNEPRRLVEGEEFTPSLACTVNDPDSPTVICYPHRVGDDFWMELHAGSTLDDALRSAVEDGSFDRSEARACARRCVLAGGAAEHGMGEMFALPVMATDDVDGYRAHAAALLLAGVKDMRVWQETYAMGLPVEYALAMVGEGAA